MFLPAIRAFATAAALTLALGACGGSRELASTLPPDDLPARVVAGSGDVSPSWVADVRDTVASELPRLSPLFGGPPAHRFFVYVHAQRDTLPESLAPLLPPESPAFAILGQHQIHVIWGEVRRLGVELPVVVRHELVHELLDQYVEPHGRALPRWLHEGLAQHLAGDTYLRAREEDLVWRVLSRQLRGLGELAEKFPTDVDALRLAYAHSYSYVSWLVREYGLDDLLAAVHATTSEMPFTSAMASEFGRRTADLDEAWREYLVHGSGAPWRVAFDQCFMVLMVLALPILVLALRRRLAREGRAARLLVETERRAAAAMASAPPLPLPEGSPSTDPIASQPDAVLGEESTAPAPEAEPRRESPPSPPTA